MRLVNATEDEADATTGFETIDFKPLINSVTVTNDYPKRLYFTTLNNAQIDSAPLKNDFTLSELTSNPYGTVDDLVNWVDSSSVTGTFPGTSFYIEGDKEWQFGATGKIAYSGTALYDINPGSITNSVETPFIHVQRS